MNERQYLVALYAFNGFGPKRTRLLVEYFGSAEKAWKAETKKLETIGLKRKTVEEFIAHRKKFDAKNYFDRLKKLSVAYTTYLDSDFPINLAGLDDAPCVLYYRGQLKPADINAVAIVGSRKMTSYGR